MLKRHIIALLALACFFVGSVPALAAELDWPIEGSVYRGFEPPRHMGIEILAPAGAPVKASAEGTARLFPRGAERGVAIDHPGGLTTTYYPLERAVVSGQAVERGQIIGRVADSGGPHSIPQTRLHVGLFYTGRPLGEFGSYLNPADYFGIRQPPDAGSAVAPEAPSPQTADTPALTSPAPVASQPEAVADAPSARQSEETLPSSLAAEQAAGSPSAPEPMSSRAVANRAPVGVLAGDDSPVGAGSRPAAEEATPALGGSAPLPASERGERVEMNRVDVNGSWAGASADPGVKAPATSTFRAGERETAPPMERGPGDTAPVPREASGTLSLTPRAAAPAGASPGTETGPQQASAAPLMSAAAPFMSAAAPVGDPTGSSAPSVASSSEAQAQARRVTAGRLVWEWETRARQYPRVSSTPDRPAGGVARGRGSARAETLASANLWLALALLVWGAFRARPSRMTFLRPA